MKLKSLFPEAATWVLSGSAILLPVTVTLVPRFFENELKHNSTVLWGFTILAIAAGLAVAFEKSWSKRREKEAKQRRTQQEGFFRTYAECVEAAIKAAQSASELSDEEIHKTQQAVLNIVCNIVTSFLDKPDGLVINASPRFSSATRFCPSNEKANGTCR